MESLSPIEHHGLSQFSDCSCGAWWPVRPLPERVPNPDGYTSVYLIFGYMPWVYVNCESLLYIGVSDIPAYRWTQHRDQKWWWRDATWIEQRLVAGRQAALEYEAELIEELDPAHNRTGSWHLAREKQRLRNQFRLPRSIASIANRWSLPG